METTTRFQVGHRFSKGRPKGSRNKISKSFLEALESVESEKQMSLYEHFIKRAYEDDSILIAVMKKLLPDKLRNDNNSTTNNFVLEMIQRSKQFGI